MRAKSFFYVCAGLFLLALGYHLGAQNATAQSSVAPEVAILSGTLPDGGTMPLPVYADGVQAQESECHWTVSPATLQASINFGGYGEFERCMTEGRTVRVYWCLHGCGTYPDCSTTSACRSGGTANYFIIAVRNLAPTPVQQQSLGSVKARYR